MRLVSDDMTEAWLAEDKTGPRRPVVRATISRFHLKRFPYDTKWSPGGSDMQWENQRQRNGAFTSAVFGGDMEAREIRNIKSYTWSRSVDQDVATCSITLLNSEVTPIGNPFRDETPGDFDMAGWFTYNRGDEQANERWGFGPTGWEDLLIPDRLVKTYEGYGIDHSVSPAEDSNLIQSGTWLIDKVTYSTAGTIEVEMRDIGRLLIDQIVFPPVIPYGEYPLSYDYLHSVNVPGREPHGGTWEGPILDEGSARSSNSLYAVETADDPQTGRPYVEDNENVWGHIPTDAVRELHDDANPDKPLPYWLSTGQGHRTDKVWWEFDFEDARSIAALRLVCVGGPYRLHVSLRDSDGNWRGKRTMNYEVTTNGVDLHAGVPYVKSAVGERGKKFDIILKKVYHDIKRVRITFSRLWDTQTSDSYPWRAGLRSVQIYRNLSGDPTGAGLSITQGTHLEVTGNYRDYTDIVKTVCCWGGFYWPGHGQESGGGKSAEDYILLAKVGPVGEKITLKRWVRWETNDPRLARGRAWGDFMNTGTHNLPGAELTVDLFDKQPLMDIISYLRDMIGFVFFIDEQGGAIWRMPNFIKQGNYLTPVTFGPHTRTRTNQYVTLDENETLLDYSTTIDSEANREVIFVANLTGTFGVAIEGYAPSNAHLRRTAGWTDSKFSNRQETRIMADLIATQQMFNYRKGRATIPGYPAIQIDDQVKIFERVTGETFFHYVSGVDCNLDMESGEFTYQLTTHWLGEDQETWVLDTTKLAHLTQVYLDELGVEDANNGVVAHVENEGGGGPI